MNAMDSRATASGTSGGGECPPVPFNISSYGILENKESPFAVLGYSLPLLELQIILIFSFIFISHLFLRSIGIPQFVSHMLAGLVLGPQLLDLTELSSHRLSQNGVLDGNTTLNCMGEFGFVMFTFLMAVKTNWGLVFRNGKTPFVIAFSSLLVPLFVCIWFRRFFPNMIDPLYMPLDKALWERTSMVSLQSLTLLPVVTHLLSELKILNSHLGRLAVSAAVIADFAGILLLAVVTTKGKYDNVSPRTAFRDLAVVVFLFLVAVFVVKPAAKRIVDVTPEGKPVRKIYLYAVVMTALGASVLTSYFRQRNVIGPLLIGLVIPGGQPLGSALEASFEKLTVTVLLPISVAVFTMKGDVIMLLYEFDDISYNVVLVVLTLTVKFAASFLPCLLFKIPLRESAALAVVMCCRGTTELFIYQSARDRSVISQTTHTFLMLYVLLSAGIVPVVVNSLYDPKKMYVGHHKRNIMNSRHNSDLRILLCLHKPDNISSTVAFLKLLVSSHQVSHVAATILHLVKLVGRSFPDFISHGKNSSRVIDNSYIQTAILEFKDFECENDGSVSMNIFTAITKVDLMRGDINTLAIDQLTSMIVVPSGRRWSVDGSFESDDIEIRRLNVSLLEHAPCSIGILVDRGCFSRVSNVWNKKRANTVRVCVIFIGGKDDREALSLAKRMSPNPMVHLTVLRFFFSVEPEVTNWEYILDCEVLNDLNDQEDETDGSDNSVSYAEKMVNNGPEIVAVLRSLAKQFDLVITGRDHGVALPKYSGLNEWIELPELGIVGDMLSSRQLDSRVSVLVVQQQ